MSKSLRLPQVVSRLEDILWWLEDIDTLRYSSASPQCLRSTNDTETGKKKIAHIFNAAGQLSHCTAKQLVEETLHWPAITSLQSADQDRSEQLCKKVGVERYNEMVDDKSTSLYLVPRAVARISVALARTSAAKRAQQPMADPFMPSLRLLDLDSEDLQDVIVEAGLTLLDLLAIFVKEAPCLQDVRFQFEVDEDCKLAPIVFCRTFGLRRINTMSSVHNFGVARLTQFLTKLRSADLLNMMRRPSCLDDALWTGFICRYLISVECINVFRRSSEGCFVISEDICCSDTFRAFVRGFFQADVLLEGQTSSTKSLGFSGTDLRGIQHELGQLISSMPSLREISIGGSVTCNYDLMGCLIDGDTLGGLTASAPQQLSQLQVFRVLFSDGLGGNVGLVPFLRVVSPSLQELDFSGCDFDGQDAALVAHAGCAMPSLRMWRLVKCPISSKVAAKALGKAVARFGNVQSLSVKMCIGWNDAVRSSFIVGLGDYPTDRLESIDIGNPYRDKWPPFSGPLRKLRQQLGIGRDRPSTGAGRMSPATVLKRPASTLKRPASKS